MSLSNKLEEGKNWYQSRTIQGSIGAALVTIFTATTGLDIGDIFTEAEPIAGQIDASWISIQAVVMSVVVSFFRIKAKAKLR